MVWLGRSAPLIGASRSHYGDPAYGASRNGVYFDTVSRPACAWCWPAITCGGCWNEGSTACPRDPERHHGPTVRALTCTGGTASIRHLGQRMRRDSWP